MSSLQPVLPFKAAQLTRTLALHQLNTMAAPSSTPSETSEAPTDYTTPFNLPTGRTSSPSTSPPLLHPASASNLSPTARLSRGKVSWNAKDDGLLLEAYNTRCDALNGSTPKSGKGGRLSGDEWDAIAEEIAIKGGNSRSGGASKARWKVMVSSSAGKGELTTRRRAQDELEANAGLFYGAESSEQSPIGTRAKKRQINYAFEDEESPRPSQRRASTGSTSFASPAPPVTRSTSAAAPPSTTQYGESDVEGVNLAVSPEDNVSQRRPWTPSEDTLLMSLKTRPATKYYSYAQLVPHFVGRNAAGLSARWARVKSSVEVQRQVGVMHRKAREERRDRRIKAKLTGPRRMTWTSFVGRLSRAEVGGGLKDVEESDEGDFAILMHRSSLIRST